MISSSDDSEPETVEIPLKANESDEPKRKPRKSGKKSRFHFFV